MIRRQWQRACEVASLFLHGRTTDAPALRSVFRDADGGLELVLADAGPLLVELARRLARQVGGELRQTTRCRSGIVVAWPVGDVPAGLGAAQGAVGQMAARPGRVAGGS